MGGDNTCCIGQIHFALQNVTFPNFENKNLGETIVNIISYLHLRKTEALLLQNYFK